MPNYVKVVPSIAIAFVTYEKVREMQDNAMDTQRTDSSAILFYLSLYIYFVL
jgi:hypothetical protein